MYNLAMLHGSSGPQLGLFENLRPSVAKRKIKNSYKKAKRVITNTVDDGLDKVGDFADAVYKYSGAEKLVDISQKSWDEALELMDNYIWEPIKKASFKFIKDKLVKKYGDELIKIPVATVVGYGTVISAQLITFLNVTFPGYGTLISAGVPPLVTALVYAVVEEIKEEALKTGKKTLRKAEDFFNNVLNDEVEHANLILAAISPEDKYNMSTKQEEQKAAATEYYQYSMARPGINAPSQIITQVIEVPEMSREGGTGRTVKQNQTVLKYFSTGKTYTTPYTPDVWMAKFKQNNPNSTAFLQANGIVVSIAPANVTPQYAIDKKAEIQKALATEYYQYSMARPGINAPSQIITQVIEVPEMSREGGTGRTVKQNQTVLKYFSTGKTYTTPYTPDVWMAKFKQNNPNSTAFLQANGTVVSIAPANVTPASYSSPGGGGGSYANQQALTQAIPTKSNMGLIIAAAAAAALLLN